MPLQNRVLPTGEIVAQPWRGALMGNRGCLHDDEQRLGHRRWRHHCWVTCKTTFRGRHRAVMPMPGAPTVYTALFFWDEASAFAAGHRPCGECRHADYQRFRKAWTAADLPGSTIREIDRALHAARVRRDRSQVRTEALAADLPRGTFILLSGGPALWDGEAAHPWSPEGYSDPRDVTGRVTVLTPTPLVTLFRHGYTPESGIADQI